MECLYKYQGEWLTREQVEDITLLEPLEDIKPDYESYIEYKENLIYKLENRLAKIAVEKKEHSSDLDYIKNLTRLESEIDLRLNGSQELGIKGLVNEVAELKNAPQLSKLDFYVEKDIDRLSKLSQSIDQQDLAEARTIINFYKKIGEFDINKDHPILEREQIYDNTGKFILPDDVRNKFEFYSDQVNEYENIIKKREEVSLEELINSNSKVRKLYKDKNISYEEAFSKKEGLKDISWIDMFVMDITNGITSDNGLIPQVSMNVLKNSYESKLVKAKEFETKINSIQDNLEKELSEIEGGKYKLSNLGIIGVKGVSYDLFRAKNKDGLYKDNITQRYSPEFFDNMSKMYKAFDRQISKALGEENPNVKSNLFAQAYKDKQNWYRKNTIVLDVRAIPEIQEQFPEYKDFFRTENNKHSELLKTILGEQGYKEEVNKQIKLIKDYEVALEVFVDKVMSEHSVEDTDSLPIEGKNQIETWIKRNNPFVFSEYYYNNQEIKKGKFLLNPTMSYNYSIPRKKKVKLSVGDEGAMLVPTNENTGFYDDRFEIIESNPTLKEFHNILTDITNLMYETLPTDVRNKYSASSIPALKKNIAEIMFDDSIPILERIAQVIKELYDKIRGAFGRNIEDSFSQAKLDPTTGKPDYKVNSAFLKTNKEEIDKKYGLELLRFKKAMNLDTISRFDLFKVSNLTPEAVSIIADNLGISEQEFKNSYTEVEPAKLLKDSITDQVVRSNSFDLPKILKLYSFLTMEYAARQEALPVLTMLKNHYEEIKNPSTTSIGEPITNFNGTSRLEGERKNANRQFESWFQRVVLGNYGSKNELGDDRIKRAAKLGITGNDKIDSLTGKLQTTVTGKIYNSDEKVMIKKIDSLLENTKDENEINYLLGIKSKLGKDFSLASAFDALFNFVRFKGLGWNVSSYVTNFMEGQIANFTIAATGDYFKPENIYRANDIVKGSFLKNISFDKVATPGATKTRVLMDRYRILQDASNELQKASTKTSFSAFKKLSPYEGTRRTEYLNQAPLMIAMLLDIEVVGKDGEKSNLWDAMDSEGQLIDNFKTEENIENWEKANGQDYNDFATKIAKAIVNTHGDYDQLRGNVASEYISGKAIMMFKRWMARQFYQRFGKEQIDLEAEIGDYKGRYRSHTQATGALHGGIIGFAGLSLLGAGPLGLVIGASAGLVGAKFYGANSDLGFLKELSIVTKEMFMNMVRIPVNTITGKPTIRNIDIGEMKDSLSERDVKNLQSNLVDMSLALGWVSMLLFTKALLWGDDDEEGSVRRNAHNLLANRFMQLAQQSAQYVNPVDTWSNTIGNIAIMRFLEQVGQTAVEAQDFLEGKDILQSGPNAGESALLNQVQKTFFPGILKDNIGFSSQMERQFQKSPFDTWFYNDETKAEKETKRIRAKYRKELRDQGIKDDKELNKKLNEKFKPKRKGQTYIELLDQYNKVK